VSFVVTRITSRHNPIVARFREVARGDDRDLLLLDGAHLVEGALDAGLPLDTVLVSAEASSRLDIARLVSRIGPRGGHVMLASAGVMDAVSPVRTASPIVALAARPVSSDAKMYAADGPIMVAADIQDPGNLGAIVRVADAGGAAGVVAAGKTANPFGWKALRGSMSSGLRLPISIIRDLAAVVSMARTHGRRIVATLPRGGVPHLDADLRSPTVIMIGGEGAGLPPEIIETADLSVTIPMAEGVESLNAAAAAAILVYEARRQRKASPA
jgi:TrmH family RNA methyltransferase